MSKSRKKNTGNSNTAHGKVIEHDPHEFDCVSIKARDLSPGDVVVLNDGTTACLLNVEKQTYETVTKHDVRILTYRVDEDRPAYILPIMGYEMVDIIPANSVSSRMKGTGILSRIWNALTGAGSNKTSHVSDTTTLRIIGDNHATNERDLRPTGKE